MYCQTNWPMMKGRFDFFVGRIQLNIMYKFPAQNAHHQKLTVERMNRIFVAATQYTICHKEY